MVWSYAKKTTCGQTYLKELPAQAVLAGKRGKKLQAAARRHSQRIFQKHEGR